MSEPAPDPAEVPHPHTDTLLPGSRSDDGDATERTQVRPSAPDRAGARFGALADGEGLTGYELLEELGRGGMGVVYKARCRALNRNVALKMVLAGIHADSGDLARFRSEAEVIAQLQHPNIVQIYEIGEQHGRPYVALELVGGGTLSKVIAGTPQPTRPAAHLVEILARAVHFAHQRGVVHRDLKPGNVLLAVPLEGASSVSDPDGASVAALYGIPKITDFGLAKRLEDGDHQTQTGDVLGTPSYMAPEQAGGQAFAVGPTADVYALGAILYDMLTGHPPFKGATTYETIHQVRHAEPVPPSRLRSRLPKDLERICLKCLEKDPRRRYATALELAEDLRRHLNGETIRARPAPPHERLWRWARRNPVPAGLLFALTLGAVVGFWHFSELSQSLVRSTALESAEQQAETMDEVNRYYGRVSAHLNKAGVAGDFDWDKKPGELTMPPPATMTIDLGQNITARSESGMQVRLYSNYPFKRRLSRPPPDDFERAALDELRRNPSKPYYRFEDMNGRPVLRFATARVMEKGCINCHNNHPEKGPNWPVWKEGDVRGVLEIIRPLDQDQERISKGLRGTVFIVAGSGAVLLGLSVFLIYLGNRRHRLPVRTATLSGASTSAEAARGVPVRAPATALETSEGTAVSAPTAPVVETVVAWQLAQPIGTLTPVRLIPPADGILRLTLTSEDETTSAELRAEPVGEPPISGVGSPPFLEVPVRGGRVVNVRLRTASAAAYVLTAELVVTR